MITKANAQWIDSLSVQGNQAIADQVAAANSRLARSRPDVQVVLANYDVSFAHHRVCDQASWINGLRLSYRNFLRGGYYYQTSFHPDRKGQAAIANWVDGYAEAAAWNQAHLAAQSLTPGTTSSLLAAGFAPGEQVTASLHSVPVDLGRYRASSSGMVSVPVRIPPGFTPGTHTVVLTGETSRRSQTFRITVSAGQNRWYLIGVLRRPRGAAHGGRRRGRPPEQTPAADQIRGCLPLGVRRAPLACQRRRAVGPPQEVGGVAAEHPARDRGLAAGELASSSRGSRSPSGCG